MEVFCHADKAVFTLFLLIWKFSVMLCKAALLFAGNRHCVVIVFRFGRSYRSGSACPVFEVRENFLKFYIYIYIFPHFRCNSTKLFLSSFKVCKSQNPSLIQA